MAVGGKRFKVVDCCFAAAVASGVTEYVDKFVLNEFL